MVLRWLRGLDSVQFHHTAFENTESCFEPFLIKIKFSLMVRCCSVGTHYKKFALASCSFHAGCEHREILRASKLLVLYNAFSARKASGNFRHHSCQFRIIIKFTGLTDFLNFILNVVSQGCTFNDTIGLIYHEIVDFGCFPAYF